MCKLGITALSASRCGGGAEGEGIGIAVKLKALVFVKVSTASCSELGAHSENEEGTFPPHTAQTHLKLSICSINSRDSRPTLPISACALLSVNLLGSP